MIDDQDDFLRYRRTGSYIIAHVDRSSFQHGSMYRVIRYDRDAPHGWIARLALRVYCWGHQIKRTGEPTDSLVAELKLESKHVTPSK